MQVLPVVVFAVAMVSVSVIWQKQLAAPTATGQAEALQSQVVSPQPGRIISLKAVRFQMVKKGDFIASILPSDPRNELSAIQTELDIVRARIDPATVRQRTAADYEKLRLEVLLEKARLGASRVQLELERNEFRRAELLFKEQLIPKEELEQRQNAVEKLEIEIAATAKAIAETEPGIEQLGALGRLDQASEEAASALKSIVAQEARLKAIEKTLVTITLEAPMDGMVSVVFRQAGEQVQDGEPILTICSAKSGHIVSYLRQPFPFEPTVGMDVEVRTRSMPHQASTGKILNIGVQVEPITNALSIQRPGTPPDMGRPFSVSFPPGLKVLPGEIVDLILRPSS
jgi:multidrug resistance efflux pump